MIESKAPVPVFAELTPQWTGQIPVTVERTETCHKIMTKM